MERGELVGDDLIIAIVKDRLSRPDTARGFVLDGFPRTVPQAEALDELLADRGPLIVVEIQVPDEELVRRVVARRDLLDAAVPCRPSMADERGRSNGARRAAGRWCRGPTTARRSCGIG